MLSGGIKKISLLILSIFCLYYDHLGSVSALSTAFFYLLMLQIACVPLLFQTNSIYAIILEACLSLFWPDPEGFVCGLPNTQSPLSEPNFTDSHIERQVQKQQGVTRVQLHLSCGLFIIQVDACWRQFGYFSCLSKRVGGVIQFNFETNPTLCTRIGREDYKKVLVKYINFSYRKCLSSQWQLVLWRRISLPPSQGVFGFVLFIISVMRVFVISIFGWEK